MLKELSHILDLVIFFSYKDKKYVLGAVVNKEGHAVTIFWNMKGPITIDFLEKCNQDFLLPSL